MATNEEKVEAVMAAMAAMSSEDRQSSAKRFVAMWDAMEAFLSKVEPLPEQPPEATLLVSFRPSDEIRPQVERINNELLALIKEVASARQPE